MAESYLRDNLEDLRARTRDVEDDLREALILARVAIERAEETARDLNARLTAAIIVGGTLTTWLLVRLRHAEHARQYYFHNAGLRVGEFLVLDAAISLALGIIVWVIGETWLSVRGHR